MKQHGRWWLQGVSGVPPSPRLSRRASPSHHARQRLTLHGLPTTTVTGPDIQHRAVSGAGSASQQGSVTALESLAVPYVDDDDDETPVTTPTTACPTPTSAPAPPSTPSTPGPTAEQLYHMMLARTGSSRHRRTGRRSHRPQAGRMSQLESRFAAAERLRRSRSPQPSAARLASCPPVIPADHVSSSAGHDNALVSSSPSTVSLKHGQGLTPPHSARPRCGTGDKETFKWSLSSEGDRKLSSASQLPNVIIDDSLMDAQVRRVYTLCLKKSSHLYTLCNFVKY